MSPALPVIPETAPFTSAQRLWLNGYLAGLLGGGLDRQKNGAAAAAAPAASAIPILILFGSQTGTAEKLAKQIAKAAKTRNGNARVIDASEYAKVAWNEEVNLLVVTSTYGDGDMPDNAQGFWSWLQTDAAAALAHLSFSVLALGDSNYEQFCAAGKKIDARLEAIGAQRLHPLAECDVDYERNAGEWTESVLNLILDPGSHPAIAVSQAPAVVCGRNNPCAVRLTRNERLNAPGSEKETRHFEISLEGSALRYEAGDALGVFPRNCPDQVAEILGVLGCSGDEPVKIESREVSFHTALLEHFDISKPSGELLEWVAPHNPELRDLLAGNRRESLKRWLFGREVIDLLVTVRNGRIPPDDFIGRLKKLAPRLYSISSSPKAHAGQVHLTVNVVRYESHGRPRKGIASTFLADRAANSAVPVFIQTAQNFRLPANHDTPVIMVGPGTGVAPFRAFLHERRAVGSSGRNWLFFGEQRAATDFYYRDELERMRSDGHLTKFSTAFSRDQSEKVYVQHRMIEEGAELWSWLENGAHFYVCGNASRMAKDVDNALHQIVQKHGGKSSDEANAYIMRLKAEKRYQKDVY